MNIPVSRRSLALIALMLALGAVTYNRYGASAELATTLHVLDVGVFSESDREVCINDYPDVNSVCPY